MLKYSKRPASESHSKGPDCHMCNGGMCAYADGGQVKGVHKEGSHEERVSKFGSHVRDYKKLRERGYEDESSDKAKESAIEEHKDILHESRKIKPKLQGLAHGGEVEAQESDEDSVNRELREHMGMELGDALEKKDKKRFMDSLEALILSEK